MMKKALFAVLLVCAAAPCLAQQQRAAGPPPSPYAPLQDHPSCTRDELKQLTAAYVEAQRKGSLAALPMDPKAHYLENGKDVDAGAGMWAQPLQVDHALSFHDDKRCKTFTEVVVTGPTPYVIGTRLYAHNGKIIRVDSLVTKKGDWLFNANSYLKFTSKEDWSPLYKYQLTEPKEMIRGANAYLDGFPISLPTSRGAPPVRASREAPIPMPRATRMRVARSACRRVCSTSPIGTTSSMRSWGSSMCSAGSADGPSRRTVTRSGISTVGSARYIR